MAGGMKWVVGNEVQVGDARVAVREIEKDRFSRRYTGLHRWEYPCPRSQSRRVRTKIGGGLIGPGLLQY